jgi:hypothetical protein
MQFKQNKHVAHRMIFWSAVLRFVTQIRFFLKRSGDAGHYADRTVGWRSGRFCKTNLRGLNAVALPD